jgi:hypothetical protein
MLLLTRESSLRAAAEAYRRVRFKGEKGYLKPFHAEAGLHILLESMLKMDPDSRHAPKVLIQNTWFDDLHSET